MTRLVTNKAMALHGVYAITDEELLNGKSLISKVAQALEGGVSLLQYRSKSANQSLRLSEAKALKSLCTDFNVPLIINDDLKLCLEVEADGLHIGQSDIELSAARSQLDNQSIIGVTCHSNLDSALKAQHSGADYVAFGRFFPSVTKPDAPPAELEILQRAKAILDIPVVAIGGINEVNAQSVIAAGADMIAVINYLFEVDKDKQVKDRARSLANLFT